MRGVSSLALVVLATLLAAAGGAALYVRQELLDSDAFADRAATAIRQHQIHSVVATELVFHLTEHAPPDLLAARPLVQQVVEFLVESDQFKPFTRRIANNAHRLLFARQGSNAVFEVADAGIVVASALRSVAPQLAKSIPKSTEPTLLKLRRRNFATKTLLYADWVRWLGIVLPILALLAFAGAVLTARDRRAAVTRIGVSLGVAAVVLVFALGRLKEYVVSHALHAYTMAHMGGHELPSSDIRRAMGATWGVYMGDLTGWALGIGAFALVMAAVSASLVRPFSAATGLERARTLLRPPASPRWRALRGGVIVALGVLMVKEPTLATQMAAVIAGAVIVYYGAGELVSAIHAPGRRAVRAAARGPRGRVPLVAGAVGAATAVAVALVLVLGGSAAHRRRVLATTTCNGYAQLCGLRLDEVVFAGTHNSMSASDSVGWYIPNQRRTISRQLTDGIRFFKISPHYGFRGSNGYVRTDFEAENRKRNRVTNKLSPQAVAALQRFGGEIGLGGTRGSPELWLCHTVCELGATRMLDALVTIRKFVERNPGAVLFIDNESFVKERDLALTYERSGLLRYTVTLDPKKPLPTLRELISAGHNVIVVSETPVSGRYAWNMHMWDWVQDTPLKAQKPREFTCRRNRGTPNSPLLMINNWADGFPPLPSANRAILRADFIRRRVRQCNIARQLEPSIIASDYYDRGDLVRVVSELNGVDKQAPAKPN